MKRMRRDLGTKENPGIPKKQILKNNRWILYPAITLASLILIGSIALGLLSRNLPSLEELEKADEPLLVTRIYSADGQKLTELFQQQRVAVPLERMPEHLILATIANEDRRFWQHWGLDLVRVGKAILVDVTHLSKREGASTITQQLARRVYWSLKKTWARKLKEQLTALQIERTYSKSEILEMYLNWMPLGRGTHGVQAAAQSYFHKNVEELDLHESAMIAGMFQLPYGYYHPDKNPEAAVRRRNVILRSMTACNFLTEAQYDSVSRLPLGVADKQDFEKNIAPYFCEYVTRQLSEKYGMRLWTDGFTIYTTLDTRVQACADSAVNAFLPTLDRMIHSRILKDRSYMKWFDPPLATRQEADAFLLNQALRDSMFEIHATLQTALIALDPTNGHILSMIGGRDFEKQKWNRAVQMQRQPGSSFKPLVYTVAIDNGYPTTYEILNQPVVLMLPDGSRWSPGNYDGSTGGPTTLREALRRSLNLVTVRLVQEVIPPAEVVKNAKNFGLTTQINPYDAIALGADVVIPLEMVSAFSVFANHGVRVDPVAVLRVEDKDGNILEEAIPNRREVISEQTAYIMTDLLRSAINEGTGQTSRSLFNFNRPAAGKTGTTNNFTDAWFLGFTPQITAGVWVGFDEPKHSIGEGQSGAVTALPIWAPFMRMVYDTLNLPFADFMMPPGVVRLNICAETKKIATESCPEIWNEVFTLQTAPKDTCRTHNDPFKNPQRGTRRSRVIF